MTRSAVRCLVPQLGRIGTWVNTQCAREDLPRRSNCRVSDAGEEFVDGEAAWDQLLGEGRFDGAFMFIYSPRPGTPAGEMEQLPLHVRKSRMDRLLTLQNRISIEKNHEAYAENSKVVASQDVRKLLRQPQTARANLTRIHAMNGTNHLFSALEAAIPSREKTLIEQPDGKTLSYGEVFDLSAKISGNLIRCGVQPVDRDAVQIEKSWQNLALYLVVVRAGGVYLRLNTAYPLA